MRERNLPVPKALIDKAKEPITVPCLDCPHLHTFNAGRERIWPKARCLKGWLPDPVSYAALQKYGINWGSEIRKLAGLCPYEDEAHSRLYTIQLWVTKEEASRIDHRMMLMLETLPLLISPIVVSKSWT